MLNLNHTLLTNDSALLLTQGNFTQCIETVSFDGAIINVTGTAAQQLANALVRWGTKTIRFLGENSIISDSNWQDYLLNFCKKRVMNLNFTIFS